jgi:polar amino acid transport system substrate-binding protein
VTGRARPRLGALGALGALRALGAIVALALLATACSTRAAFSPAIPPAATTPQVMPSGAQQIPDSPASATAADNCNGGHPTASLSPHGPLPTAGLMPAGSYMATIYQRGYLIAGVDQNTLLWGYRNAAGQLAGFDIEMVDHVAQAIFGPSWVHHIHYVIVPNKNRIPDVSGGQVDIVAETMTITCSRQQPAPGRPAAPTACCVDFSTEYYDAAQRVLVPDTSSIHTLADLAGKRVCAIETSTSLANLTKLVPAARQVAVVNETDCLVLLQQGQVDAISTDDTILEGLAAQDPNLLLLNNVRLSDEPYGMAISKAHPDFTRFVNGVLAHERSDGVWTAMWTSILGPVLHRPAPLPPAALYRD